MQWPTGCPFTVFDPWGLPPSPLLLNVDIIPNFFFFWPPLGAYGILFSRPGIKPGLSTVESTESYHWIAIPNNFFFLYIVTLAFSSDPFLNLPHPF